MDKLFFCRFEQACFLSLFCLFSSVCQILIGLTLILSDSIYELLSDDGVNELLPSYILKPDKGASSALMMPLSRSHQHPTSWKQDLKKSNIRGSMDVPSIGMKAQQKNNTPGKFIMSRYKITV